MATIGTLGDIVFSVSRNEVRTFENLKWSSSAKYTEHSRNLQEGLLEYTGTSADTMSFSMYFSAFLGINPMAEISKLLQAERNGKIMTLVIGNKAYGKNKWVITKLDMTLERYDQQGNLLVAKVNVALTAYAAR